MITLPADTPVTTPDDEPTDAWLLLLLQTPPVATSVKVTEPPMQIIAGPLTVPAETALTVTTTLAVQMPPMVYAIVDVPALTPDTTPEADTVATPNALLLHTPPPEVSPSGVVAPAQTVSVPVIGAGGVYAVTVVTEDVVLQPPPEVAVMTTVKLPLTDVV